MTDTFDRAQRRQSERLAAIVELHTALAEDSADVRDLLPVIAARTLALTSATGVAIGHLTGETILWDVTAGSTPTVQADTLPEVTPPATELAGSRGADLWLPVYEDNLRGYLLMTSDSDGWTSQDRHTGQIMAALAGMAYSRSAEHSAALESVSRLELPGYQVLLDQVTGLPTRTLLYDRLQQGIQIARREDEPLTVLIAGVVGFDRLLTELGTSTTNAALVEVASRLRDTLRASDTVARSAPDRFGIVLPGANAIGGVGTAKKLLRSVASPFEYEGQELTLEIRVGVAVYPEHGQDPDDLLDHAERALNNGDDFPRSPTVQLYEDN